MRTGYVINSLPVRYSMDRGNPEAAGPLARAVVGAGAIRRTKLQSKASQNARRAAAERVREQFREGRIAFRPDNQPRDSAGKFRKVLARLKLNLGDSASEQLAKEMEAAEAAGAIGDYAKAKEAGANVVELIDAVEDGDLQKGTVDNIREGSAALGRLLTYLPLPQGDTSAKVRFSDLPAPTAKLIKNLIKRVDERLDNEEAAKYTAVLKSFMSGGRTMSSDEMSTELARILRVLA